MIETVYRVNPLFCSDRMPVDALYGLAIRQIAGNVTRDHAIDRFEEMRGSRLLTSQ